MARFFHTPKPKKFNIEPRYWDSEREEWETRKRRIHAEMGIKDENDSKPNISKGEFRKGMSHDKWSANNQKKKSNSRLLLLILMAIALLWYILK